MEDESPCNPLFDIPGLKDIKETPDIVKKIRWESTPRMVMEPRYLQNKEDLEKLKEIAGYMFYIETQCEPPALMLMKVGQTDIASTVGIIQEIPPELIERAIENPVDKPENGMYAITEEIKEWLKKALGV
ncbi:MAG TPA: hypothetical protein VFG09_14140 [Thermodesulfovibrionales bacterium]|nr:hypothetical protein [Thermodesulfovibrionales bacterium]